MATEVLAQQLAALSTVPGIGRRTLAKIFYSHKKYRWHWQEFWVSPMHFSSKIPLSENQALAIQKWYREYKISAFLANLESTQIRLIIMGSKEYPPLLAKSEYPPVLLFAKGASLTPFARLPIAVVGSRAMTSYGRVVTSEIVRQLCQVGASIVSGCMYGIDTIAHLTALEEKAQTIAVLGFGFNHVYPATQQPVIDAILAGGGTLLTEYPPDTRPTKGNFVMRNSIVAGLSRAVVVTEAAKKSGSHTTAQFALDSGRSVCAIPGPMQSSFSEGTKWLINEGAVLTTSAADILLELGLAAPSQDLGSGVVLSAPKSALEEEIIALLQTGPKTSEILFAALSCSFAEYQASLTTLELQNYLERVGEQIRICY